MIADDTRNIDIPLSRLPSCEEIIETMAHLTDEDSHTRTYIAEIEMESHLIALSVESVQIVLNLISRNQEVLQFPFYSHKEHAILTVNILIEIDDVSIIVGDELCQLRDDSQLVWTVQE